MSALIRYLGARYPIGQWCSTARAFAIVPVVLVYGLAWASDGRGAHRAPARHANRGVAQRRRHVLQFRRAGAATLDRGQRALVHLAADQRRARRAHLKERVRIYRWSAVTIGFLGVLVVLAPHFSGDELTIAMASRDQRCRRDLCGRGLRHQCRHHDPDATSDEERDDIVDRVLLLADLRGRRLVTWPFGWSRRPTTSW